jgi:hypothetical protein
MPPVFSPWVGPNYSEQPVKVLLLDESHDFFNNARERVEFTQSVIGDVRQYPAIKWGKTRMFSRIYFACTGKKVEDAGLEEWAAFWDGIAFYNYLQTTKLKDPRTGVLPELWIKSKQPFFDVLKELKPDLVFAFGHDLFGKIWDMREKKHIDAHHLDLLVPGLEKPVRIVKFRHPSSPRFKLSDSHTLVTEAMAEASSDS